MPKLGPIHTRILAIASSTFLALLLVAIAWYYRDDLFQNIYDPGEPFQTYAPPPTPNYKQAGAWLIRPGPDSLTTSQNQGDVFVVGPTIYLGGNHWNAPIDDLRVQRSFERIVLPNYVLPYAMAGRVYSPIYRQASLYSFLTNREDARAAQEFAYRDIRRAFAAFLDENPPERPIVLVGHGQGGLHVQRLLADFKSDEFIKKLAVAYIIDHPLMVETVENKFPEIQPCANAKDSRCIVAFSAFMPQEAVRAEMFTGKTMVWDQNELKSVNGRPLVCVNPLIWNLSSDFAPARLHLGGVAAEGLDVDTIPAPSPKQTSAQCVEGILEIDKPKQQSLRRPSRFGGKFRTPESNLFYEDLRVDAQRRVQNLIDLNELPRLAPLMDFETIEIQESPVTLPQKPIQQ